MALRIVEASQQEIKLKINIAAPTGGGKTFSSILLAKSLAKDEDISRVIVIDSENKSSQIYADKFRNPDTKKTFMSIPISSYEPETYIEALELVEKHIDKFDVVVMDSLSHAWVYSMEWADSLSGNSFTNIGKAKKRYFALINKIIDMDIHIITTHRQKMKYAMEQSGGRTIISRKGLDQVSEGTILYEFSLEFTLDGDNHYYSVTKDRLGAFSKDHDQLISEETGLRLKKWLVSGEEDHLGRLLKDVRKMKTVEELKELYNANPQFKSNSDFKVAIKERQEQFEVDRKIKEEKQAAQP